MKLIKLLISGLLPLALSCTTETSNTNAIQERAEEIKQPGAISEKLENIYFNMPAPEEVIGFLNDDDLPFIDTLLNPLQKDNEQHSFKSQSLNLGIYLTDLAYILLFDQPNYTMKYFSKITNLAKELRIAGAIEEARFSEFLENMSNTEEMSVLFHEFYFSSIDYFMKTEQHQALSLIASGALIESFYLASNSFEDFQDDEAAFDRFAELKFVFENLMEYLQNFKEDPVVKPVFAKMKKLGLSLAKIEQIQRASETSSPTGSESSLNIREQEYREIKSIVETVRNTWVNSGVASTN